MRLLFLAPLLLLFSCSKKDRPDKQLILTVIESHYRGFVRVDDLKYQYSDIFGQGNVKAVNVKFSANVYFNLDWMGNTIGSNKMYISYPQGTIKPISNGLIEFIKRKEYWEVSKLTVDDED